MSRVAPQLPSDPPHAAPPRRWLDALAPAVVLALAAGLAWGPRASWTAIALGALGAASGALLGHTLAHSAARAWAIVAGAFTAAAAAGGLLHLASFVPVPGGEPWPELAATLRDALQIAVLSALVALLASFPGERVRLLRILPPATLALALAALLAPHRGGAINRPYQLADLAWLQGWHPALLLTLAGTFGALLALVALLRRRRGARLASAALAVLLLAVALVRFAPDVGLIRFPLKDPLGLSGKPREGDRARTVPRAGSEGGRPEPGSNPLGLERRDGQGGGHNTEMAPFQDDYSSDGGPVPVAVVVLRDDVKPSGGMLYFRQVAFSSFNGRRLVRSLEPGMDSDLFEGFALGDEERPGPDAGPLRARVPATVSLIREHVQPPVLTDGRRLVGAENADPALFRRTYDTESAVLVAPVEALLGRSAGDPSWSEEARRAYLEGPEDPRYAALAQQIAATLRPEYAHDPWAKALAVGGWLQENTKYSVRSRHASADDPTASYLFGDRIGYCVHLAHAGAYLLRALGVPTRVSAGYAYDEQNRTGGSALLLRSGDAHAWAEVYLQGVGWVPLDPGPESLDPPGPAPDLDLQRLLGEMARPKDRRVVQAAPEPFAWPSARQLAAVALLGLFGWAGIGHAAKGWRRLAPRLVARDPVARLAYRAALDRLAEVGLERREGETREAFAARAAVVAPSFPTLTAAHLAARFGLRDADPASAERLAAAIGRELRRHGGWRRRLGLLAPWRWLRSR